METKEIILYCYECGKRLINTHVVSYNTYTGEPKRVDGVCPSGLCGHHGINHEYNKKWYSAFISKRKCIKCNETIYFGGI